MLQDVKISECKQNDIVYVKTEYGNILKLFFVWEHLGTAWTSTDIVVENQVPSNIEVWTKIYKEV